MDGIVWVTATIVAGDPDLNHQTECPTCGFDSVITFPLYALSTEGVDVFGDWSACLRCWPDPDEE